MKPRKKKATRSTPEPVPITISPKTKNLFALICGSEAYWTEERLEEEAQAIIELSENEEFLCLKHIFIERGYSQDQVCNDFLPRSEAFRKAHTYIKAKIGARRERKGLKKELSETIVGKTLHNYDTKYFKDAKELKKAEASQVTVNHVQAISEAFDEEKNKLPHEKNSTDPKPKRKRGRPKKSAKK